MFCWNSTASPSTTYHYLPIPTVDFGRSLFWDKLRREFLAQLTFQINFFLERSRNYPGSSLCGLFDHWCLFDLALHLVSLSNDHWYLNNRALSHSKPFAVHELNLPFGTELEIKIILDGSFWNDDKSTILNVEFPLKDWKLSCQWDQWKSNQKGKVHELGCFYHRLQVISKQTDFLTISIFDQDQVYVGVSWFTPASWTPWAETLDDVAQHQNELFVYINKFSINVTQWTRP
jgi:hypothetical protein